MVAQVCLVGETALRRDVAQGRIGREHVLSGQFHAASYDEGVRRLPECALEGSREVRLAALNKRAKIRNEYRPGDMTINVVMYLVRLPGEQAPTLSRLPWINLLPQQRGRFKQGTVRRVLGVVKLTNSRIKQLHHPVHPLARSRWAWLRHCGRVFKVSFH